MRMFFFAAVGLIAAEPGKPRCSEGRLGQFWPIEANFQSNVRWRAAREGSLEICKKAGLLHRWTLVRMHRPVTRRVEVNLLSAVASVEEKPKCDAGLVGQFWPLAANSSANVRRQTAQEGSLEICARTRFRYQWKPLSFRYRPPTKNGAAEAAPQSKSD